jgi:hypothetical protein
LANGCKGGPVRLCDVSQQVLFAQQPCLHAFSLGVFAPMHVTAGNWTVTATRANPTAKDATTLLIIAFVF